MRSVGVASGKLSLVICSVIFGTAFGGSYDVQLIQAIDGSAIQAIDGSAIQAIDGSAIRAIDGSAIQAIDGSAIQAIDGSALQAIDGSALQAIDGSALQAIDGSAIQAIDGSAIRAIDGSAIRAIDGSAIQAIDGSAIRAIDGSAVQAIDGSAIRAIDGSAIQAIDGSAIRAIDGSAVQAIDGSAIRAIDGSAVQAILHLDKCGDLLIHGPVTSISSATVSILDTYALLMQDERQAAAVLSLQTIAIFGEISEKGIRLKRILFGTDVYAPGSTTIAITGRVDSKDPSTATMRIGQNIVDYATMLPGLDHVSPGKVITVLGVQPLQNGVIQARQVCVR